MSYETRTWAWGLKALRPATKLTLMVLADVADEEGRVAYCSHKRMCTLTNQSVGTVKRILKELASLTLLVRLPRFISAEGVVNHEGVGRQASDGFVLKVQVTSADLDVLVAERKARAKASGIPEHDEDDDAGEGSESTPPTESRNSAPIDPPGESLATPLKQDSKREDPPKGPQGGFSRKTPDEPSEAQLGRYDRFQRGYPKAVLDPAKAKRALWALPESDQDECISRLPDYAAHCRKFREKPMKAHLFIAKHSWTGFDANASEAAAVPTLHPPRSVAGRAITVLHRIAKAPRPLEIRGMISYRHAITPKLLALADAPPEAEWIDTEVGSNPNGAWRAALDSMLGGTVRPKLLAIRAPWIFPPGVDGKIYTAETATGPPIEPQMTEEDEREFTKGL
jgi:hypothetical protein